MRIIDKNTDFYDYIQNIYRDNNLTFDRRDSFILTRAEILSYISIDRYHKRFPQYLMLQVGHSHWLFEIVPLSLDDMNRISEYELKHIGTWKDYNRKSEPIKLSVIRFEWYVKDIESNYASLIANNDYKENHVFNKHRIYKESKDSKLRFEERHIPILRETGLTAFIDPNEIYLALEEYFSEEKTANERTEPLGATNNDKITAHGFDTVTSFRGKR